MARSAFHIGADGWCDEARRLPSPNFDERPQGAEPSLLVIHNISLPPGEFGGSWISGLFTNTLDFSAHPAFEQLRGLRVSAHFLIRRDGELVQFVSCNARAWHAGVSSFGGKERCNDFSIGIEMEGSDFEPFTDAQYETLTMLTRGLSLHCRLTDVAGHEHIAPGRKTDPGPFFDWEKFHRALLGDETALTAKEHAGVPLIRFPFLA